MITFVFLFFLVVCGIAAYFIAVRSKKRPDGTETRPEATETDRPNIGRASGGGDD